MIRIAIVLIRVLFFIVSVSYKITVDDETIIKPCDDDPENFLSKFLDISNLTFEFQSEDEILVNGNIVGVGPFETGDSLHSTMFVYRESGGRYQESMITIQRRDFCKAMFSPTEMWFFYTSQIKKYVKNCPPQKGEIYKIRNFSTKASSLNFPDYRLSGSYRTIIHINLHRDEKIHVCFLIDVNVVLQ